MMGVENIEQYSRSFAVLKAYLRIWHDKIFYRKVVYVNRETLPLNDHLIFTPNHQNALMDALAIEFSLPNQFVFVARSDIFKNKYIARLLYFFKILPVYRIRDGYESLKKNEMTFKKTLDIIRNKNGFVILPEGNHAGFRRLRALKKGFARIAFQAEEAEKFLLDMKIVPVGINYSDYEQFRTELLVVYGKPFPVSPFYEVYKQNPAVAYNRMREKLAQELKPLMIHIDSVYYEAFDLLRIAYREKACLQMNLDPRDLYHRFRAEKQIIACLEKYENEAPEKMKVLAAKADEYLGLLKKMKLQDVKPVSPGKFLLEVAGLLLTFPLFLYGYLNNFFPWNICVFAGRKIKDPQFRSSFKFVLSFLSFPLFYLAQSLVVYFVSSSGWFALAYFATLPLSAAVAWNYAKLFRKSVLAGRFLRRKGKKDAGFIKAEGLFSLLMKEMDSVFKRYSA